MKYCLFLGSLLLCYYNSIAQSDSTQLTYKEFIKNVALYHPITQQADVQLRLAENAKLAARGGFDPKLASSWNDKFFDKKQYYRIFSAGFKVPTDYGLTVSGGYENTEGIYLNPENKTDKRGLWSLGIEANILQGLLIDERRTALKQAEVFQKAAQNERKLILNELFYKASISYLYWQQVFRTQEVIQESVVLANVYFENTKQSFLGGDKPAIDTLEAALIVQDRQIALQKNTLKLVKIQQQLENFLWFNDVPLVLQSTTKPERTLTITVPIEVQKANQLALATPIIVEKNYKIDSYTIERRLKKEKLKPKLKVKYNPLLATTDNSAAPTYSLQDYKWGFEFSMPLFRRSERAALEKTDLKILQTKLEIKNKTNELTNKIEANLIEQQLLQEQLELQRQNVVNYAALLAAEQEKFAYGESSVFLLNKRQEKYLEVNFKWIDLTTKFEQSKMAYWYLIGDFEDFIENRLK